MISYFFISLELLQIYASELRYMGLIKPTYRNFGPIEINGKLPSHWVQQLSFIASVSMYLFDEELSQNICIQVSQTWMRKATIMFLLLFHLRRSIANSAVIEDWWVFPVFNL